MAQLDFTPTPRRALQANEGDESPRESEGLSVVDEIPTAHEADDTLNYHSTGAEWPEEDTKDKFLEIAQPEVDFSGLWPDLGFGVVSFFSGNENEMRGHGEDLCIYPTDNSDAESRMYLSVGVRPVYSKPNQLTTLADVEQASEYLC
jgi:hypothetical protein